MVLENINIKMVIIITVLGKMIIKKVKALIIINKKMILILETGLKISKMVKENIFLEMVMFMKGIF